jgi:hypothetical protein
MRKTLSDSLNRKSFTTGMKRSKVKVVIINPAQMEKKLR